MTAKRHRITKKKHKACMDAAASLGISESESFGCSTYPRRSVCKIYSRETLLRIRVTLADTYARILYMDFSSAFNTILPQRRMEKVLLLGPNTATCLWIQDFLTERPQSQSQSEITLPTPSH